MTQYGDVLTGKWGGTWEFVWARELPESRGIATHMYRVKSVRTGYITEMRNDSFV